MPKDDMEEEFDIYEDDEEDEDELEEEPDCYCVNWFDDNEDDVYVPASIRNKNR